MMVLMDQLLIYMLLGFLGLTFGSFAGATVWRLRARQLVEDKADGEPYDKKEYKTLVPLTKTHFSDDRSCCLHCGHTLAWYDLIPLFSWLSLKGKCRYCHKTIGWFEPLMEIGLASFFIVSFIFWPTPLLIPLDISLFGLWLLAGILLLILFAYDIRWFLLPNTIMFPLIALAAIVAAIRVFAAEDVLAAGLSLIGAVIILSGLYFILWLISKGEWIGFGDVKLGLALALLLGEWQLAFIALFAANLIGCLVVIPGMLRGKVTRATRVPFGPLLIVGCVIAMLFGVQILDFYVGTFL